MVSRSNSKRDAITDNGGTSSAVIVAAHVEQLNAGGAQIQTQQLQRQEELERVMEKDAVLDSHTTGKDHLWGWKQLY